MSSKFDWRIGLSASSSIWLTRHWLYCNISGELGPAVVLICMAIPKMNLCSSNCGTTTIWNFTSALLRVMFSTMKLSFRIQATLHCLWILFLINYFWWRDVSLLAWKLWWNIIKLTQRQQGGTLPKRRRQRRRGVKQSDEWDALQVHNYIFAVLKEELWFGRKVDSVYHEHMLKNFWIYNHYQHGPITGGGKNYLQFREAFPTFILFSCT